MGTLCDCMFHDQDTNTNRNTLWEWALKNIALQINAEWCDLFGDLCVEVFAYY